jgi:phage gp36-like protein
MPIYAQIADLVSRYGEREVIQLTDRATPPAGAIDSAVAGRALEDADAEIDGYLGVRYALPLASVPPVLTRAACDIARYRLWDDQAPDEVRARYTDVVRFLEGLAAGRVTLGMPDSSSPEPAGIAHSAPGRIMRDLAY